MVVKMTNRHKEFYKLMGRFFGSREIEKELNDRIYDDKNKIWYICVEKGRVLAFVSVNKNVIKNIYAVEEIYLEDVLKRVIKEIKVTYSTVTKSYIKVYEKCGFEISKQGGYKNFVIIYMEEEEAIA